MVGQNNQQQALSEPTKTVVTGISTEETTLPCNLAYSVLAVMSTFPSDNDDKVYEALSNALVRRVIFVKGAVDMSGLPPPDRGEVAFIGRSNVGKSFDHRHPLCFFFSSPLFRSPSKIHSRNCSDEKIV